MSDEVRRRCLEPFFSTKGKHGTGLGLSLVHATVERHQGSLTIDSVPGQGTTFTVRLPARGEPAHAQVEPESLEPARPMHVLVVDDDPLVRTSIVAQLKTQATRSRPPTTAERTRVLRLGPLRADRDRPGDARDGWRSARRDHQARTRGHSRYHADRLRRPDDRQGRASAGVDAIVSKPVTLDALNQAIRKVTAKAVARR